MYFVDLNDKERQYKFTFHESREIPELNSCNSTNRAQTSPEMIFIPLLLPIRSHMNDSYVEIPTYIQYH